MLSWLMLSLMASLGIFGRKCEVAVVGNKLPHTLLMVSVAMRIWLSSGLVNSRICLHLPTLIPHTCWHRLEVSVVDMASLSFSADSVSAALKKFKHGKHKEGP